MNANPKRAPGELTSHERYPLIQLTPAARPRRRFPWQAAVVGGAALAAGTVMSRLPERLGQSLGLQVVGVLCGCILAAWLEDRLFTSVSGRPRAVRVLMSVLVPLAGLVASAASILAYQWLLDHGKDVTPSLVFLAWSAWVASAGIGTLIVVLLDIAISGLVRDLRSRITLAVLALVLLVTSFAVVLMQRVPSFVQSLAEQFPKDAIAHPETQRSVTLMLFAAAAVASLPAVFSACSKLAEAVMERLHPLAQGFEAVAKGQLNVRVEEGGSRDFISLARSFNKMVASLFDARRMERAFSVYVSQHVMERIRGQHGEATIPASLRQATVFFADVRGFTSMSEKLAPAQVLEVLNRYFDKAVPIVEQHEGYLDKFIGDAMVVVFNGPIEQPDHGERAVRCAIALQQTVAALNAAGAFPEIGELSVGIGVATGLLVAGNLGSVRKMEYTVIGDTVNLASRLTAHAGPGEIFANQATVDLLPNDIPRIGVGPLKLRGKEQAVHSYRLWPQEEEQQAQAV